MSDHSHEGHRETELNPSFQRECRRDPPNPRLLALCTHPVLVLPSCMGALETSIPQ